MTGDRISQIEAILSDIEQYDGATRGQFRQAEDREAFDIVARMERRMLQQISAKSQGAST